jgi:hypothetical protein
MEKLVTHELERRRDGSRIVRNFFFNEDKTNYMTLTHSHFSKHERDVAKLNYKKQLTSNNN